MRWEAFVERIMEEITQLLPEDVENVINYPVTKNNGIVYTGLVIQNAQNIAPTIYLNPYYQQYLAGRSFEAILSDIADTYKKNSRVEDFDARRMFEWEFVKTHVVRKLVNYEQNQELLENMPHKRVEDLAILYQISVGDIFDNEDYATVTIQNDYLKKWDVTLEELDNASVENTRSLLSPRLDSLSDVFSNITGDSLPFLVEMNVHILTNRLKINGAVHVVDMDVMESVAKAFGEKAFYVIPSSVHEVLLLPFSDEYDCQELEDVIKEVNETQLMEEEVLSDRAYVVDVQARKFMLAAKYTDYKKEQELKMRQQELQKEYQEPEKKLKL